MKIKAWVELPKPHKRITKTISIDPRLLDGLAEDQRKVEISRQVRYWITEGLTSEWGWEAE